MRRDLGSGGKSGNQTARDGQKVSHFHVEVQSSDVPEVNR